MGGTESSSKGGQVIRAFCLPLEGVPLWLMWTELNSPLEGWQACLTGWNKVFINNIKTLHPVSPLCKHSRNPPLKRGILVPNTGD